MTLRKRHLNWISAGFFVAVIAIVVQQVYTSMTEQGIASGGPYDNAAAYPLTMAILIGGLLILQLSLSYLFEDRSGRTDEVVALSSLGRPLAMLAVFAVYLGVLGWLGYHLATPPMVVAIMYVAGMRNAVVMIGSAVVMSVAFAFMFEFFLKIVLPGGVFGLNIPW